MRRLPREGTGPREFSEDEEARHTHRVKIGTVLRRTRTNDGAQSDFNKNRRQLWKPRPAEEEKSKAEDAAHSARAYAETGGTQGQPFHIGKTSEQVRHQEAARGEAPAGRAATPRAKSLCRAVDPHGHAREDVKKGVRGDQIIFGQTEGAS